MPTLEADAGVVKVELPFAGQGHPVEWRSGPLGAGSGGLAEKRDGLGPGLGAAQVNEAEGVGEVVGHISFAAEQNHRARAKIILGQPDPLAQPDEKGQVTRHFGLGAGGGVGISRLGVVGRGGDLGQPGKDGWEINDADLMRAGMGDEQRRAVSGPGNAPGVGGAAVNVVQQDGVEDLHPREVNDGRRIAVHPAAVKLGCGQAEVGQNVRDHGVFAVRGDAQVVEQPAAVGQSEFLDHLAGGGVNDADDGGDVLGVSRAGVQMIRHEQKPPIAGDIGRRRLALDRDAA